MKTKLIIFSVFLAAASLILSGCRKDIAAQDPVAKVKSMDDLKVSSTFNWETTREVTLNIGVDIPTVSYQYNDVSVYLENPSNNGAIAFQGFAGNNFPLIAKIRIPTAADQLFIQLTPYNGQKQIVTMPVSENMSYTFKTPVNKNLNLGGPDCSAATAPFTLSGSTPKTINDGHTWYVTGSYSGNVTITDGTLQICGIFTGSVDMGQNGNNKPKSYLIVSSTGVIGSAGSPVTVSKNDNSTFTNWGTCHIAGTFTPQDLVQNFGTMTVYGQYNMNGNNGNLVNSGLLTINSHWNLINAVTNNGTIEVFGELNCNNSTVTNDCSIIVHGTFHLNNCQFTNNTGYLKVYLETFIQGSGFMKLYNGSMISTTDLRMNNDIQGFGTRNEVKVSGNLRFDGPNVITGPIECAQTTGTLVSGGPSNFTGGATFVSFSHIVNTISVTECNPEGNTPPTPPPPPVDNTWTGTAVYEDLWPAKGDYDLNDLVMAYKFKLITNNQNKVTDITIELTVKAVGATYQNGFGIQFDNLLPSDIASVTGYNLKYSYITLSANGTESGQSKAVIIAFDNAANVIHQVGGMFFNTVVGAPVGTSDVVTLNVHLTNPMLTTALGTPPYNPFLIRNMERVAEIHLPNYVPTSKAVNCSYFGTGDDNSIPGLGRYYKTSNNLPWALNIPVDFDYPWEKACVIDAYTYFAAWAQSDGLLHADWYKNLPGYRNSAYIWHQ